MLLVVCIRASSGQRVESCMNFGAPFRHAVLRLLHLHRLQRLLQPIVHVTEALDSEVRRSARRQRFWTLSCLVSCG